MTEISNYNGVEDTLFIPLTARIYASKRFPAYFYDEKSLEFEGKIANDIMEKSNEYTMLASCARYYRSDKEIKKFCHRYDRSNVVFLGAGLETAYYRLKDKHNHYYEVDLEDVINNRKKHIGCSDNDMLIAADMFSLKWVDSMDVSLPTIIVVNGVFQYFTRDRIFKLLNDISKAFKEELEILFDATNEKGLKFANRYVKKTGNKSALMSFYVNDAKDFTSRINNATLIAEYPFFGETIDNIRSKLKFKTRVYMWFADHQKSAKIVHIKLNAK